MDRRRGSFGDDDAATTTLLAFGPSGPPSLVSQLSGNGPLPPPAAAAPDVESSPLVRGRPADESLSLKHVPAIFVLSIMGWLYSFSFGYILLPAGPYQELGVTIYLLSTVVGQVVAVFRSSMSFAASGSTYEMIPLFHSMAAPVLAKHGEDALPTLVAMYAGTTLFIGVSYLVLSRLKLGFVFRFIPFVVLNGALAGVGVFVLKSMLEMSTARPVSLELVTDWSTAQLWLTSALLAFVLLRLNAAINRPYVVSVYFLSIIVVFNGLWLAGLVSFDELVEARWLFSEPGMRILPASTLWRLDVGAIDWGQVLEAVPAMAGCCLVHALVLVMDLVSAELLTGVDVDLDKEMECVGLANTVGGLLGVMPNYLPLSPVVTNFRMGGHSRSVGAVVALCEAAGLVLAPLAISYVPRALMGTFFAWLGWVIFQETVIDKLRQVSLSKFDLAITLSMPAIMLAYGMQAGLLFGLVTACVGFTVLHAQQSCVRAVTDGLATRSNIQRPRSQVAALDRVGGAIKVVHIHGVVGFASMPELSGLFGSFSAVSHVVLDFRRCTAVDLSAATELYKLRRVAADAGWQLVFAEAGPDPLEVLEISGCLDAAPGFRYCEAGNEALEQCENEVIAATGEPLTLESTEAVFAELFGRFCAAPPDADLARLRRYFSPRALAQGEFLWQAGDSAGYFVVCDSARVHVLKDRRVVETLIAGSVAGYITMWTHGGRAPQPNTLRCEQPGRVMLMSREAFERMEREEPHLAQVFVRATLQRSTDEYRHLMHVLTLVS